MMNRTPVPISPVSRPFEPIHGAGGNRLLTTLTGMLLLSASVTLPIWADTPEPDSTTGTYRSSESSAYTAAQLGEALSLPLLPDPAAALNRRKSSELETDRYSDGWHLQDAWITDIGLLLYDDADTDGYFAAFSLSVDADTRHDDTDVYLSIDTQRPFQRVERLHTSHVFPLYGQSASDEYRIDIELLNNFPQDHYDLIIELRDAYDHRTLDRVDSADFSNLRHLPLESEDLDDSYHEPVDEPLHPHPPFYNDDVRVDEYAGSSGWLLALTLSIWLLARRWPRATRVRGFVEDDQ